MASLKEECKPVAPPRSKHLNPVQASKISAKSFPVSVPRYEEEQEGEAEAEAEAEKGEQGEQGEKGQEQGQEQEAHRACPVHRAHDKRVQGSSRCIHDVEPVRAIRVEENLKAPASRPVQCLRSFQDPVR